MSSNNSNLFSPVRVGNMSLSHRVVLAPLTRIRNDTTNTPTGLSLEYYTQRASVPGSLLITEASIIAAPAGGYRNVGALHTDAQLEAHKKITDSVHAKGSFIYAQLWALGRVADPQILKEEGIELVGAGDIPLTDRPAPRPLTRDEIKEYAQYYATAAHNAVNRAGYDGVEIHMANGYLPDQFLQDVSNNRTDEYGGSIENRARFPLEILGAVANAVGEERTAIRLSPFNPWQDMKMKDPKPTFSYLVSRVSELYPSLSYLHVVEPRLAGPYDDDSSVEGAESSDFLREIWSPKTYISAGGYTRRSAMQRSDETGELIAFGRMFISNPDLPLRLKEDIPLKEGDRSLYYAALEPRGYIDYPFAGQEVVARKS